MPERIERLHGIDGLSLIRHAISAEAAARIVERLQGEHWQRWRHWRPFSRQDFGHTYDLSSRGVEPAMPIPEEIAALFPALREAGWTGGDPTQVIVTRYPSGGSLGPHIDSPVFGPEIGGLSLETEWPIVFSQRRHGPHESIPLPVLSAYVMRDTARTSWFHQIPPTIAAERISLTFRTLAANRPRPRERKRFR